MPYSHNGNILKLLLAEKLIDIVSVPLFFGAVLLGPPVFVNNAAKTKKLPGSKSPETDGLDAVLQTSRAPPMLPYVLPTCK